MRMKGMNLFISIVEKVIWNVNTGSIVKYLNYQKRMIII